MNRIPRQTIAKATWRVVLTLAIPLLLVATSGGAQIIRYLDDGAIQNANGGWDLPAQGTCPAGAANGYTGIDTRPECVALRLNFTPQATCTADANRAWSTGVCNDLVNNTQPLCAAAPDRLWNPGTNVCAIVMMDDDRNDVVCALHGGTWVTSGACTGGWIMPARDAYEIDLLTGNGAGDQCLRCHNSATQYNGPRVRDTEDTLYMGHKNMGRKIDQAVGAGHPYPWGGPPFACSNPIYVNENVCEANGFTWDPTIYPGDDSGHLIDWATNTIDISGVDRDLKWIYGDWLAALPRAIYAAPASTTSKVCTNPTYSSQSACETAGFQWVFNAGATYSCGRCHMTGWTSDSSIAAQNLTDPRLTKEPERSFQNITWDRNSDAGFGVVNLTGGVTGDANKYSSWDVWGISCTRCHNSAIDASNPVVPAEVPPRYNAPAGMSTHHNNLTAPDISSGACSDTRFTAEAQCVAAGGTWMTACSVNPTAEVCTQAITTQAACVAPGVWVPIAGWCSNAFYTTQPTCTGNGFTWQDGWCARPDKLTSGDCAPAASAVGSLSRTGGIATAVTSAAHPFVSGEKVAIAGATPTQYNGTVTVTVVDAVTFTYPLAGGPDSATGTITAALTSTSARNWRLNGNQASCQIGGGTWSYSKCSMEGVCNKGAAYTTKAACDGVSGQFRYNTDIIRCEDAGGHWTGNHPTRGQTITRLCMDCHRQETGGLPYDSANPAGNLKVGPAHGTVSFVSHPAGNEFLNSPHGKFSGSFSQIATSKFAYFGSPRYASHFINDGEAANTGNGCTGCHEVHTSTVAGEEPFREECTECHDKDVNQIVHPTGVGTPIVSKSEPFEACIACHMPEGRHLFRINASETYSTFPMPAAVSSTVNANTADDDGYAAVWVDLDLACGQCHGGGTNHVETTGTISAGSAALTVANATGLAIGQRIEVAGAGGFYYDEEGEAYDNVDLETFIKNISGTTITLVGTATKAVTGAAVAQNPVKNNAAYFTKTQLAGYAKGIHNDKPTAYFTYKLGNPNTLSINVDASPSTCSGSLANCNAFAWSWGDGTCSVPGFYTRVLCEANLGTFTPSANGSGLTASHTYPAAGTYPVTLTVTQYSIGSGTRTNNISVYTPDLPPVVGGTCSIDANTWVATVTDTSTDTGGIAQVVVNWGDNSVVSNDTTSPFGPFGHTYIQPGNFTVTKKVVDSIGQQSTQTCVLAPAYFTISGNVKNLANANVQLAAITVKKGLVTVRTVYTDINGNYTVGNLKPGTYSLTAKKTGLIFPVLPTNVTVGPAAVGVNFQSSN